MIHDRLSGDGFSVIPPHATELAPAPGAFVVCPCAIAGGGGLAAGSVEAIYRLAYEQARAALLPPWHERNLLASFN